MNCLRRLFSLMAIALFVIGLVNCSEGRKRPPGYLKIGNICELGASPQIEFLEGNGPRIILHQDNDGYSAMSTQCTFDLSDLSLVGQGPSARLRSRFNESEYTIKGLPTHGPTVTPLPYYRLELASAVYGGPPNTLYVRIGSEVPEGWRLRVNKKAICGLAWLGKKPEGTVNP